MRTASFAPLSFDQRSARQSCFARARVAKRRQPESSPPSSPSEAASASLKRMRLASPPSSPSSADEAIVAVQGRDWRKLRPVMGAVRTDAAPIPAGFGATGGELCTAMVVFDPRQARALSRGPRIELVESDSDETTSVGSSEDEGGFVRFEELPSDNDEPVDMDID